MHPLILLLAILTLTDACREDNCYYDYTPFYHANYPKIRLFYQSLPFASAKICDAMGQPGFHEYATPANLSTSMILSPVVDVSCGWTFSDSVAPYIRGNLVFSNVSWLLDMRTQCCNWTRKEKSMIFRATDVGKGRAAIHDCCGHTKIYAAIGAIVTLVFLVIIGVGLFYYCRVTLDREDPVYAELLPHDKQ